MIPLAQVGVRLVLDPGSLVSEARKQGAEAGSALGAELKKGIAQGLGIGAGLGIERAVANTVRDIKDFFADSIRAAIEEEASVKRLTASLEANAKSWDGNIDAVKKAIAAREELAFSDDDLRDSLTTLVGATHDVNKALDVQTVAMDLARYKNISLAEASDALIKVEAGRYRVLASLGIVLKQGATETEALAAVEKVAAGQAVAFSQTTSGAFERLNIKIHDLQENVGGPLADAFANLIQIGENAGDLFDTMGKKASEGINSLTGFAQGASDAKGPTFDLAGAIGELNRQIVNQARVTLFGRDALDIWGARMGKTSSAELPALIKAALDTQREVEAVGAAAGQGSDYFSQFASDADNTGKALDGVAERAIAAANGLDTMAKTDTAVQSLEATLRGMYGIAIDDAQAALFLARGMNAAGVAAQFAAAGIAAFKAGHPTNSGLPPGSADTQVQFNPGTVNTSAPTVGDQAALDAANAAAAATNYGYNPPKRTGGRGGGSSAASAEAKAIHDEVVKAYAEWKAVGDNVYDAIHARNTQAISDAHDLSRQKIDADHTTAQRSIDEQHRIHNTIIQLERDQVDRQLAERRRLNAEPVTAAEKAQQAIEAARRTRDLSEQLQADIAAGADAKTLRADREALQSDQANAAIAQLREQQQQQDEAAQAEHDQRMKDLDTAREREDATYKAQSEAEEAKYKQRLADSDTRYKLLQHDEDVRAERQKKAFDEHVTALENSKNATVGLAEIETKRYLQEAIVLAKEALKAGTGTQKDVDNAIQDLADFVKSIKKHALGGWVGRDGPELAIVGDKGPEYIIPAGTGLTIAEWRGSALGANPVGTDNSRKVDINVTNYYPAPEPADGATRRSLQILAATGVLS